MNDRKKNILLVTDNSEILGFIKKGFEYHYPAEFNLKCINCEKKFIKLLEKRNSISDVILFDISISKIRRWGVLDYLKHNSPWRFIPIVFLSIGDDVLAKNFGNFFGDVFVENPFEFKNIKIKIEQVLT